MSTEPANEQTTPPPVDPPAEGVEPPVADTPEGRDPAAKARAEARNLRNRLKAAEAERDAALAQVEAEQARASTAEAASVAARQRHAEQAAERLGLHDGRDLWRDGRALGDVHDPDTGGLDDAALRAAVDALRATHPHLVGQPPKALKTPQGFQWPPEPALDAPEEQWSAWRTERAKLARGGATPTYATPEAPTTWTDVLGSSTAQARQ